MAEDDTSSIPVGFVLVRGGGVSTTCPVDRGLGTGVPWLSSSISLAKSASITTSCSSTIGCAGRSFRNRGASASCGDDIGECDRARNPVCEASVSHDLVLCKHGSASGTSLIGNGDGDLERGLYGLAERRFGSDAYKLIRSQP